MENNFRLSKAGTLSVVGFERGSRLGGKDTVPRVPGPHRVGNDRHDPASGDRGTDWSPGSAVITIGPYTSCLHCSEAPRPCLCSGHAQ